MVKHSTQKENRFVVWDEEVKGFGIRVNRDGSKTFVAKYFINGRQRWLTLGKFGVLTVEQARKEARHALGAAAIGEDIAEKKKIARVEARANALTLEEFCGLYLSDAEAGKVTYRGQPKKASTLAVDRGRIKRHIVPLLGSRRIGDITSDEVEAFRHAVRSGATATTEKTGPHGVARVRGGETASNRALGLLGSIFSYNKTQAPEWQSSSRS